MTKFPKALSAWNTEVFDDVLRIEINSLGINSLPLGEYVDDERVATLTSFERCGCRHCYPM